MSELCGLRHGVMALLAWGEGWHNNHHAFPASARHGLRWWQVDVSYWCIRALAWLGLARKLKLPDKREITARAGRGRERPAALC
jgi:stearoyl-CoA desaturase (delta-9 desaturase)